MRTAQPLTATPKQKPSAVLARPRTRQPVRKLFDDLQSPKLADLVGIDLPSPAAVFPKALDAATTSNDWHQR